MSIQTIKKLFFPSATINVAISQTTTFFTIICCLTIIIRIVLGPFPLLLTILFYYLLRSAASVVILQLTFSINVKTMFLLLYDIMAGETKSIFFVIHASINVLGFSEKVLVHIFYKTLQVWSTIKNYKNWNASTDSIIITISSNPLIINEF